MKYDPTKKVYLETLGEDNDSVIIGNEVNSTKVEADIKFTRWNNEDWLSLAYENFDGEVEFEEDKLKIKSEDGNTEIYFEKHDQTLFKFGLELGKKPTQNSWEFKLTNWEQFNFFYQPELTPAELANREYRKPDVVGSYAVYHKTKKNHAQGKTNYNTGKAFHIYRPKFIDEDGNSVWGILDITDGVYTITIPQVFLDSAVYPIKANDTFGYTSIGGTTYGLNDNTRTYGNNATLADNNVTITTLHGYFNNTAGVTTFGTRMSYYDDNSGVPLDLQVTDVEVDIGPGYDDWVTFNITDVPSVVSGVYWFGYQVENSAVDTFYDSNATYTLSADYGTTYGTFPNPFDEDASAGTRQYSFYATYTPASGLLTGHYVGDMTVLGVLSNCWQKIGEGDLGAPASSFTLAGLSGDTDVLYNLILRNIDASTIGDHKLTFNADTGANYGMQELVGSTTTASALRTTGGSFIKVGETKTDDYTSFSDTFIYAPANRVRTLLTTLASDITGATVGEIALIGGVWQDTTTSISQIVVTATADNFEANTHYELWRLNL